MTVIRLDALTLAKLQSPSARLILADEAGNPRWRCAVAPLEALDRETVVSDTDYGEIEPDPIEYSLEEVWSQVRAAMERSFQEPAALRTSHLQGIGT